MNIPAVRAVVTMLPDLDHPRYPNRALYMPHIVIGDPHQREAERSGMNLTEHYLGILVADAPDELAPGATTEITMRLMYWPEEAYDEVRPGATFTLREGPNVIGYGEILSRLAAPTPA